MDRLLASKFCRETLDKYGLKEWGVRINPSTNQNILGLCMHSDKCIVLNAHHIDTHPQPEIEDTILHEVAHALVGPNHGHNATWVTKAREMGVNNLTGCATIGLDPRIIDAIRSGATVEVTFDEHTIERQVTVEEKVFKPKYTVTRLQDKCPDCGKVAVEKFAIESVDKQGNQVRLITLDCFHIIKRIIPKGTAFESIVSNDWKPEVKSCKHEWTKNGCNKCGQFKLFPFQVIGARFAEAALASQKGAGIFDDMGLGKTVQGLAVVRFHPEYTPTLYIVKSAITFNWLKEILRWLGPEYLGQIIKTSRDSLIPGLKSYIISYDLLRRFPRAKLEALGIKLVIMDECQQIKNADSSRTQEVRKFVSNPDVKVLPLSGTPWKNRGSEFFPVLNMIDPIKFYSEQHFLDTWVDYYFEGPKRKMGGIRNIKRFQDYTQNLLIRREYNEVMTEFPDINKMKLNVQLDSLQQSTYDDATSDFVAWYNEAVIGGEEESLSGIELLGKMSRMRHITGLAKIPATLGFIEEFVEDTQRKLVIFIHHKDVGELLIGALTNPSKETNPDYYDLAVNLNNQGVKIMKLTAEFNDAERFTIEQEFNKHPRVIMIASTLASGEGINLQTCADCIMHERQWNPQNEDQAFPGRFRRIGQTATQINGTYVEAEGTIDEHLDYIVENKRRAFHAVMNKGEAPQWNQGDIAKQLAELIVRKHQEKMKNKPQAKPTNITQMAKY